MSVPQASQFLLCHQMPLGLKGKGPQAKGLQAPGEGLKGKLTFAVVAERHLRLSETNGVLALGDAIELLELGLVDALRRELGA